MDFDLINENDFQEMINNVDEEIMIQNYKICIHCNIQMNININNCYTCNNCGYIKNIITENEEYEFSLNNYNTNTNTHMPIKCVGKDAYKYQKCIRNNTTEYKIIQENNIKDKLNKLNYESDNITIPKNIIKNVIDQYKFVRNNYSVFRGDILKGILGSLVYYECLKEKIIRKPREIAKWCKINESNLSKGDKIIRDLHEQGVITLNINNNLEQDFIKSYLVRLNIDTKYADFLYELLIFINTYKIGNLNSRMSTKVASLIFLLILSKDINITIQEISEEFDISISTFKTYYNNILKKKDILLPIFEKYDIKPMMKLPRKKKST